MAKVKRTVPDARVLCLAGDRTGNQPLARSGEARGPHWVTPRTCSTISHRSSRIAVTCTPSRAALADLENDPPADPEWAALQRKLPLEQIRPSPVCPPEDRSSFAAFQRSLACRFGFTFPESEIRNQFEAIGDRVGSPTAPDWVMRAIGQGQIFRKDFSNIRVPVLAMLEFPALRPDDNVPADPETRATLEAFVARGRVIFSKWTDKLKQYVPDARIVDVKGAGHYLFLTRQTEVLREIHAFMASLPAADPKR